MSMLTIKHVEACGRESVLQAHSISFVPKGADDKGQRVEAFGCTGDGGPVTGGWCSYGNGKVYVMNDAGATVGNYDLD